MKKIILLAGLAAGLAGCSKPPEFYFSRGNQLLSSGRDSEALESYNRALLIRKNYPEALTSRGLLFERQGDRQKAALESLAGVVREELNVKALKKGAEFN